MIGVVWRDDDKPKLALNQLKNISKVLDDTPVLNAAGIALVQFAARYYHQPIGEVVAAALPPGLRKGKATEALIEYVALTKTGRDEITPALGKRAPKQFALLQLLSRQAHLSADQIRAEMPEWRRVATSLSKRNWIATTMRAPDIDWHCDVAEQTTALVLSDEQQTVVDALGRSSTGYQPCLLDGVTGSGKTEVFLQLTQQQLSRNRQTLILVPEIGLTPQLIRRFEQRLGQRVALLHSNLSDAERTANWLATSRGLAKVVIGTRSAVFTPLAKPGLIIVDEEHDSSLKQHEGFRYHARDLAVWRANQCEIPILLSTATPSLESLHNAKQGRYQHFRLTHRAAGATAPRIHVIDTNRFNMLEGLSQPVIDAMKRHLSAGNQVLVYLNRRGYAPTLICSDCGNMVDCSHCDAHMTLHAHRQELQCHHCGMRRDVPTACEQCGQPVNPLGEGTERIEEVLGSLMPEYTMARIDSDTTSAKGSMQDALAAAKRGDTRILVGTQMLAKGHHLPLLTLVVMLNTDQGFFASDFRASERLAQSVIQVAGRAGRGDQAGEVFIQSAFPDHPLLRMLVQDGYAAFATQALVEREAAGWPPFRHIAVLHAAATQERTAIDFLQRARQRLGNSAVDVLGPAPASMLRRAGRYRYQLLLSADTRANLQTKLHTLTHFLSHESTTHQLRWSLDIDPQSEL